MIVFSQTVRGRGEHAAAGCNEHANFVVGIVLASQRQLNLTRQLSLSFRDAFDSGLAIIDSQPGLGGKAHQLTRSEC